MTSEQFGEHFDEWARQVKAEAVSLHAAGVLDQEAIGLAIQVVASKQKRALVQRQILNPIPSLTRRQ